MPLFSHMRNVYSLVTRFNNKFNPFVMNGFAHHYHLGVSTFILGTSGEALFFVSFFDKIPLKNRKAPDVVRRSVASHLELCPTKRTTAGRYGLKSLYQRRVGF